jgi:hypothetical protein
MNEHLIERLGAFTFILFGIVILLGMLSFIAGFSNITFLMIILVLVLGLLSLATGFAMWTESGRRE